MKREINIPEKDYDKMCKGELVDTILAAIRKGTPLPKGHGRIIDESKITQATFETIEEDFTSMLHGTIKHRYMVFKGSDAPTIIEAESEGKK